MNRDLIRAIRDEVVADEDETIFPGYPNYTSNAISAIGTLFANGRVGSFNTVLGWITERAADHPYVLPQGNKIQRTWAKKIAGWAILYWEQLGQIKSVTAATNRMECPTENYMDAANVTALHRVLTRDNEVAKGPAVEKLIKEYRPMGKRAIKNLSAVLL